MEWVGGTHGAGGGARPEGGAERDPARVWDLVRGELLALLGAARTDRWFGGVEPRGFEDGALVLAATSAFISEWIRDTYGSRIDGVLRSRFGLAGARFVVAPPRLHDGAPSRDPADAAPDAASDAAAEPEESSSHGDLPAPTTVRAPARGARNPTPEPLRDVSPHLTLERFVVGQCNRFAYEAGIEALRHPGRAYNPIFIYGGCGLGKTHLLQGMTREYFRNGERKIRYLPCEGFVNRFGQAVRRRETAAFRERFRSLRVLVLDDIQIVAGKERSQLELLETIDAIAGAGGQVIFASDVRPAEMHGLAEKLLGRFVSGLVCRVTEPDLETRLAILAQEARSARIHVPGEALRVLAERSSGNIRELIGTWVRVIAHGSLLGEPITPALVADVLARNGVAVTRVSLAAIIEEVGRRYGVPPVEFHGPARSRTVSLARHIAIYLARVMTDHSLSEIGAHLGGRRHATASAAFRRIQDALATDGQLRQEIERFISVLGR